MKDESRHEVSHIDVTTLSPSQRDALSLRLRMDEILFASDGSSMTVSSSHADEVHALIAEVRSMVSGDEPAPPRPFLRVTPDGLVVAGRSRRLCGAMVDYFVLGAAVTLMAYAGAPFALRLLFDATYYVVPTWLAGKTLGKRVAGTHVVNARTGARPLLWNSIVRWAVPAAIEVAYVFADGRLDAAFVLAGRVIVYAPLLWDREGRGLHDRAAGTLVLRS